MYEDKFRNGFVLYLSGFGEIDCRISKNIISQCLKRYDVFYNAGCQNIEFDNHGHAYLSIDKKQLDLRKIYNKIENKELFDQCKFVLVGDSEMCLGLAKEITKYIEIAKSSHSGNIVDFVFKMLFEKIEFKDNQFKLKTIFDD